MSRLARVLLPFACTFAPAQQVDYRPAIASLTEFANAERKAHGVPAISVAVLVDDAIVWSGGFGRTHAENGASADSVYRMASISKVFTAVALMRAVEAGEIDLDDPVQDYLPELAPENPFLGEITPRLLASHRAGVVREPAVGHYFESGNSLEALVASMKGSRVAFPPGVMTKYSNAGVSVIGHLLAKRAGLEWEDYIERTVLGPIGLQSSTFAHDSDIARSCAPGRMWTLDGREFPAPTFPLGMAPAANLYSTVLDLVRFGQACLLCDHSGPRVLSPDTLRRMFRVQGGGERGFGIGFFLDRFDGQLRARHSGAIYGFASMLALLPEEGVVVAAAANMDCANGVTGRVVECALHAFRAARDRKPVQRYQRPKPIGEQCARALAGRYGDDWSWVDLEARGDDLWEIPSHGTQTIYRELDGALVSDSRISADWNARRIIPQDSGIVRNGKLLPRVSEVVPPACPARFVDLLGEYGWDHNTQYVFEDGGRLCVLIEWFARYPLIELGRDRFTMPKTGMYSDAHVSFERDAAGRVTALIVGGVRMPRRAAHAKDGETFRIEALFPPEKLRAMAREARMPRQANGLRSPDLVDLRRLDESFRFDIRYATSNNFMGMEFYEQAKAMMQRPAAEALVRVNTALRERGLGLMIFDAYRPWSVTKMFWDATPETMKDFVANPRRGSRHNRGCAVDLTLHELATGKVVQTVSGYDEFTPRAYPHYPGGTARQRWYRRMLREAMEREGFDVYEWEWWHFDYRDWRKYPVMNAALK